MGLKSSLKKLGKSIGSVVGAILKPLGSLLSALLPKVKIPKSLEQSGSTYNAEARVNRSELGDIKAVVYGQAWVWPAYCSMPYKYFEGHDQILAAYLHITVGHAAVPVIRIGDTSATRFPGFLSELSLPGEDMDLVLPDVYTNPEVEQIDLLGGLLLDDDPGDRITVKVFTNDQVIFSSGLFSGTIAADEAELFVDFNIGDLIGVYDANLNEGFDFTILGISDDFRTLTVSPSPVDEDEPQSGFFVRQRWAGGYPACQPGATVETIAIDIVFAALRNNGAPNNERSVTIKVQYRPIDDAGNVIAPGTWTEDEVTYTDNANRARRYTTEFTLSGPMRPEVRVWRETYEQNDSADPSSAAQWVGLKGYIIPKLGDSPASDDDSTRLAILVRSSGALSSQSENAVNCLVQRQLPIYESGGWSSPIFTRNPAWADVDWKTTQSQGAITLANLDIDSYVESAATADANSDTFDSNIDREVGLWEGSQSILRVARSKPILDPFTRLYKVYRDEPSDPVQLFCEGFNCRAGSDSISLPDADTVTGVYVTFMDPLLWTEREGPTVGTDVDPRKVRGMGFTTWDAAWREANFEYRDLLYRNHSVSISTEMEGLLPLHGQRVLLASAAKGWGHSGEVVEQDGTTLRVWPAPIWEGTGHYVYLQDDDGVPQGPFTCTQGLTEDLIELDSDPGLTLRVGASWRSLFAFGNGDYGPRLAIVMERTADGPRTASLNLLFDHPFVHEDPGAAPVDPYETDGEIPDLTVTNLEAEQVITGDVLLDPVTSPLDDPTGDFLIEPGGTAAGVTVSVRWDAVTGATVYKLRWKYIGIPGWHYVTTIDNEATFGVPQNGTIQVRVKAESTTYVGSETVTTVEIDAYP